MLRRAFSRRFSTKLSPSSSCVDHNINLNNIKAPMRSANVTSSSIGLDKLGITNPSRVNRNLSYEDLMSHEKKNEEGKSRYVINLSYRTI